MPIAVRRWKPRGARPEPEQRDAFANGEAGLKKLDADMWLSHQLFRAGAPATTSIGVTGFSERKALNRREISQFNLADQQLLDAHGRQIDETFAQAFRRVYGEQL